jgi:hypothetical protein
MDNHQRRVGDDWVVAVQGEAGRDDPADRQDRR